MSSVSQQSRIRRLRPTHDPWALGGPRTGLWKLVGLAGEAFFKLFHGYEVEGREHVPLHGPCILAANHQSYYDPALVGVGSPRLLRYMAYEGVWKVPVLGSFVEKCGAFRVDQGSPSGGYKEAAERLRNGEAVLVFPEGGRTQSGEVGEVRDGAARLAIRADAPVVPVTVTGAYDAWPHHHLLPGPGRIKVTFHPPIVIPANASGREKEVAREITAQVARTIRKGVEPSLRAQRRRRLLFSEPVPPRTFESLPMLAGLTSAFMGGIGWHRVGLVVLLTLIFGLYLIFDGLVIPQGPVTRRLRNASILPYLLAVSGLLYWPLPGAALALGFGLLVFLLSDIGYWSSFTRWRTALTVVAGVMAAGFLISAWSGLGAPDVRAHAMAVTLFSCGVFGAAWGKGLRGPLGPAMRWLFLLLAAIGALAV